MEPDDPDRGATHPLAVPGVAPAPEGETGEPTILEVDGEEFELRPDEYGGTGYTWLTGPKDGYGFGLSPTTGWSADQHRDNIRSFLAQIDPETGYLEEGTSRGED